MMDISRENFEFFCPSAIMPDDEVFNRVRAYLEAGKRLACGIVGPLCESLDADTALEKCCVAVACLEALYEAIPHLDLVLTPNGFGVVSNQNVAPASRDRVSALRLAVRDSRDDAIDTLLDALRRREAWRTSGEAALFFLASLVWDAHRQLPLMGVTDAHRTKLMEMRPRIAAAEEVLQHYISNALHDELCAAQLACAETADQTEVIRRSLVFMGAQVAGDNTMARFHMSKLVEYLEQHLTDFPTYEASTAHQANTFTPYENKKDDTTYFFG